MHSWRDEWARAQLQLRIRASTLFHGESAELVIDAHVPDIPPDALPALQTRWRALCDGARVDVRVLDPAASPQAPPLFRQDAQLTLAADAQLTLALRCDVLVRVRSEFWGRPLLLRVRVTPSADGGSDGGGEAPTLRLADPLPRDLVLRLIREEPAAAEPLVRSLEREFRITKPLQLRAETRYMGGGRVCIVAKATNTDPSLELKVLDLQLHLSESFSMVAERNSSSEAKARSSRQQAAWRRGRPARQFRVVSGAQGQFPVLLRGAEQFNFLFVLEAVDGPRGDVDDAVEDGGGGEQHVGHVGQNGEGDAQPRAASMSRNDHRAASTTIVGVLKRPSSLNNVIANSSADTSSSPAAAAARSSKRDGATQTHQTLLTLSWEASNPGGDRLASPITEQHTIIWSPQLQRRATPALTPQHPVPPGSSLLPASAFTSLVTATSGSGGNSSPAAAGVRTVRLDAQRALSLSLAALPQQVAVGEVVTLCLVIANRSPHTSFDLTLLAPFAQPTPSGACGSWFSFEATHRLGALPPGMTVRKSVRAVALRFGKCGLNRFALFDRLSRTCFLPATAAEPSTSAPAPSSGAGGAVPSTPSSTPSSTPASASASASCAWEVVVLS